MTRCNGRIRENERSVLRIQAAGSHYRALLMLALAGLRHRFFWTLFSGLWTGALRETCRGSWIIINHQGDSCMVEASARGRWSRGGVAQVLSDSEEKRRDLLHGCLNLWWTGGERACLPSASRDYDSSSLS